MALSPFLERAYELARLHRPHPNPRVGAVVVSPDGEVIGEGSHQEAGGPHAETVALQGVDGTGATVYVSLEPCSHHGATPPCVDRLIEAGVRRVVVGAIDPDERVSGSGVERLRKAGIETVVEDDPAAIAVDPGYFHQRETGMPLVTLKYAMTADGAVAAADGTSRWITGSPAREDAHSLRSESDAVAIGMGTVLADNPRLDVRLNGYVGNQPRPVLIAGKRLAPAGAAVWERSPIVIASRTFDLPRGDLVVVKGAEYPDPVLACAALAQSGLYDILLEGGPTVSGAWWRAGVVNRVVVYVGARIGGGTGMSPIGGVFPTVGASAEISITKVSRLGDDLRIDFEKD